MKFEEFNTFLQELFKTIAINIRKLQLNGSFQSSYFASDIDLYEPVKNVESVLSKIYDIEKHYDLREIKISYKNGNSEKYNCLEKLVLKKNISFIKIDIIIYYFIFPMDCSIIYDFNSNKKYNDKEVVDDIVDDINNKYSNNLYKIVKRLNTLSKIIYHKNTFDEILDNTKLGVINLSYTRLQILKELNGQLSDDELNRLHGIIQEDLRKYGLKVNDNLIAISNREIAHILRQNFESD